MTLAFVDESGDRGQGPSASDHFVMTAVIIDDSAMALVHPFLEQLRTDMGRKSGEYLTWKNIRGHADRLHIAQELGSQQWLSLASVVVCKRHLPPTSMNPSQLYLYTFRYLLERLSWMARAKQSPVNFTLAHIKGFKLSELRHYEAALRKLPGCSVEWPWIAGPGSINQPQRLEELQLADLAAAATGAAFHLDKFGNTEPRYLQQLMPRVYRHQPSSPVTSYGLKMHPWNSNTKAAYPWVAAL